MVASCVFMFWFCVNIWQVNSTDYYVVRLYFAEIFYRSPIRIFSVLINDFLVLENYSLSTIDALNVEEFYVPLKASSLVNITFLRGPAGDPFVNAISIQRGNSLYPWINSTVTITSNLNAWRRKYALDCGSSATYWPDIAGRMWTPDLNYTMPPLNGSLDFIDKNSMTAPVSCILCSTRWSTPSSGLKVFFSHSSMLKERMSPQNTCHLKSTSLQELCCHRTP